MAIEQSDEIIGFSLDKCVQMAYDTAERAIKARQKSYYDENEDEVPLPEPPLSKQEEVVTREVTGREKTY
jgi:hypothetical protein